MENPFTRSADGKVSYNRFGQRVDSLGNVARPSSGAQAAAVVAPPSLYPTFPGAVAPQLQGPLPQSPWPQLNAGPRVPANPFPNPQAGLYPWPNLDDAQYARSLDYYASLFPWAEFGESNRRFDSEFGETQRNNRYNQARTNLEISGRYAAPISRRDIR